MMLLPSCYGFDAAPGLLHPWPYFVNLTQPTTFTGKSGVTGLTVPVPSGARGGDFLVTMLYFPSVGTLTVPTGWTLLQQASTYYVYYAFWDGSTTPAWTWPGQGNQPAMGAMFAYRNVDPTYIWENNINEGAGVNISEANAINIQTSAVNFQALYADAKNRCFVNAFISFTQSSPAGLAAGAYQTDSFSQPYLGPGGMSVQPNQQAMTTRTDNVGYFICSGVADMAPCDTTHGYTGSPNFYYGDTLNLGNYLSNTEGYANEDVLYISLMLLPIGGLPATASGGPK